MRALALFVRCVDWLNGLIGRVVSWFTLGVVLVCFAGVVMRYVFAVSFIWVQDVYVWLHAAALTLAAGYTLMKDRHVRVDLVYGQAGGRYRAWINIGGVFLFLLPFVGVVLYWSWGWVASSWALGERSVNVGGLPGLFLVKSCLIAFGVLVGLQGLALAARSAIALVEANGAEANGPARHGEA